MAVVRMIVGVSGSRDGVDWPAKGETLEVDDAEAAHLIAGRLAVPVESAPESAQAPEPETAAATRPTRRTRKGA